MANEEQVKRLKAGVEGWNKWREENTKVDIDLKEADLVGVDLSEANLREANLRKANLSKANLHKINLLYANLDFSNLDFADLSGADLVHAHIWGANLDHAKLEYANLLRADINLARFTNVILMRARLSHANVQLADFSDADIRTARLDETILKSVNLKNADLSGSFLKLTSIVAIDLRETKGLDEVVHMMPSFIDIDTFAISRGRISEKFLRGCGLSDWEIESVKLYQPELSTQEIDNILYRVHDMRANQAIQINPLFISYSHADSTFVDEMEKHLDKKGVRFWRDIHDATSGRLEKVVDRAIRQNPIVLLILSENSVKSDWVEHEARTARELEKELGRDVLCPVALDNAWKDCLWPARLREQIMEYNILDFSKWKDEGEFAKMFRKLIDGLDLFYKEG